MSETFFSKTMWEASAESISSLLVIIAVLFRIKYSSRSALFTAKESGMVSPVGTLMSLFRAMTSSTAGIL